METLSPIEQAFAAVGGGAALGKLLGRSRAAIHHWKATGVPVKHCPDIERLTGIRCEHLRPDVNWSVLRLTASAE